jgi:hypothetical protein
MNEPMPTQKDETRTQIIFASVCTKRCHGAVPVEKKMLQNGAWRR